VLGGGDLIGMDYQGKFRKKLWKMYIARERIIYGRDFKGRISKVF